MFTHDNVARKSKIRMEDTMNESKRERNVEVDVIMVITYMIAATHAWLQECGS